MRRILPLAILGTLAMAPVAQGQQQPVTAPGGVGLEQYQIEPMRDVVMQVETRLDQLGYNVTPDGEFDAELRNSVLRFQADNGLRPTGNVDLSTLAALGVDVSPSGAVASTAGTPETAYVITETDQTAGIVDDDSPDFPLLRNEHMSAPMQSIEEGNRFENDTGVPQPAQQIESGDIAGIPPGFAEENLID